jgi:hypothetical protein
MTKEWDALVTPRHVAWATGAPVAEDTIVRVRKAWLAAVLFPRVRLRCEKRRALGPLERQGLVIAARVGTVTAEDLRAVTGLPSIVGQLLLARLVNLELLDRDGESGTITAGGRAALVRPDFVEKREETAPYVLLPRTGDVLPGRKGALGEALRLKHEVEAPIPPAARTAAPVDLIRVAFEADPSRFPEDCVGIVGVDHPTKLPETCGAWMVHGDVVRTGSLELARLRVTGAHSSYGINLEASSRLVEAWKTLAEAFSDEARWFDAMVAQSGSRPSHLEVVARAPCVYELGLPGDQVLALSRAGVSLGAARSLVIGNEEAEVEVEVHLRPLDTQGTQVFVLDALVGSVANDGLANTPDALAYAAARLPFPAADVPTPDAVRRRLWQLKEYPAVYALREPEDFPRDG